MSRLVDELDTLHARYREAVDVAVGHDDFALADQLAAEYDVEATRLVAEHEGLTHLLPLRRQGQPDSRLRALVRRLRHHRAA